MRPSNPQIPLWRKALLPVIIFLAIVPAIVFALVYFILTLPYTLYFYSSNWALRKPDFLPIQTYLDHFETLHPTLTSRTTTYLASAHFHSGPKPNRMRFWPHLSQKTTYFHIPLLITGSETNTTFSPATGLFFLLEDRGIPRRDLYTLLQNEVENKVITLPTETKAEFRRVMAKVCDHDILTTLPQLSNFTSNSSEDSGFALPDKADKLGKSVVSVRSGDLGWLVEDRPSLLVPMDWKSYRLLEWIAMKTSIYARIDEYSDVGGAMTESWHVADLR